MSDESSKEEELDASEKLNKTWHLYRTEDSLPKIELRSAILLLVGFSNNYPKRNRFGRQRDSGD